MEKRSGGFCSPLPVGGNDGSGAVSYTHLDVYKRQRVDWFEGVFDFAQVEDVLKDLREALGNSPLLMTFRTAKEGGEKAIEPAAYAELNIKRCV